MRAIMSEEFRAAIRDPKKRKDLQQSIADFVAKKGSQETPTISIGNKKYRVSTPEAPW